ncbi:hypothetical protein BH10ACI4_BH10ACI4_37440 [soil metagenome]
MDWLVTTQIIQGPVFRSTTRHGKLGSNQISEKSMKLILSHYATLCGMTCSALMMLVVPVPVCAEAGTRQAKIFKNFLVTHTYPEH